MKRSFVSVWLLLAAFSLVSCSQLQPSEPPPSLLSQILPDYNARNNAAIEASRRYEGSLWKTADTAALLAGDEFDTRYAEVFQEHDEPHKLIYEPVNQYGDPPATHPKWIIGTVQARRDPHAAPTTSASTPTPEPSTSAGTVRDIQVAVFEQAVEGAPWLMSHSVSVNRADCPWTG